MRVVDRLTSTLSLEHLTQLCLCGRALSAVFCTEYPTTHPYRFRTCRKRITPVDENRGRTTKSDSFRHLRRLDQLVFDGELVPIETLEHVGKTPIGQLPMRASVEVLNRDLHCTDWRLHLFLLDRLNSPSVEFYT